MITMDALRQRGREDLVLLDDISEESVVDLLKTRFEREGCMYTYMGPVLIAINPFKVLSDARTGQSIYHESVMDSYRGRVYYEMPPSVFAIAEGAYSHMMRNNVSTSVIISGESGAGKTETARQILAYIARVTTGHKSASAGATHTLHVKDRLVTSTLVTEAFGNAMTTRNDNSSRFGKLMSIAFRGDGSAANGFVQIFLLEKHRVVYQAAGERCFHAFYYLLAGASPQQKKDLHLTSPDKYALLANEYRKIPGVSDAAQFKALCMCMTLLDIKEQAQQDMWKVLAVILNLGNINFESADAEADADTTETIRTSSLNGHTATVQSTEESQSALAAVSDLLGVTAVALTQALTRRTITVGSNTTMAIQTSAQARSARDSLAKAMYERLFALAVGQVNDSIKGGSDGEATSQAVTMSILDLYGFEIFDCNGFEQLCINFVNESLQQLFIEATLKAEQEEYQQEGIEWTPIDYFDNRIVVELFEKKPGVFAILDDACAVADATPDSLCTTFNAKLGKHAHYAASRIHDGTFTVRHYAGDVSYSLLGMIDANRDYLSTDLIGLMTSSNNETLRRMFQDNRSDTEKHKRPPTAGAQFRQSVASLIEVLRASCPYYIRCIKSNDSKKPVCIDLDRLAHQCRYLGLVEATRVKRAGFAYRATFTEFLQRYRMISSQTWPPRQEDAQTQIQRLLTEGYVWTKPASDALQTRGATSSLPQQAVLPRQAKLLPADFAAPGASKLLEGKDYQLGATKLFLKEPKTLFALEYMRISALEREVSKIAALWRAFAGKRAYARIKRAWLMQQANVRARLARKAFIRMRTAAVVIQAIVRGHQVRVSSAASTLREALGMIKCYGKIRRRLSLQWEVPRKCDWVGLLDPRIGSVQPSAHPLEAAVSKLKPPQTLVGCSFADFVWKIKQNYTVYRRVLVVTENFVLNLADPWQKGKINRAIAISAITGISMSPFRDNYVVLHVATQYDYVCICETKIHLVRAIVERYRSLMGSPLPVNVADAIIYKAFKGDTPAKGRRIDFRQVSDASVFDHREPQMWERKLRDLNHGCGGPPAGSAAAVEASLSVVTKAHVEAEKHQAFHMLQPDAHSVVVCVPVPLPVKLTSMLTDAEKIAMKRMGVRCV